MTGVLAEGLVKRFGSFVALAGVTFEVPEGTITGLLGPNGAGKTTTIRILTTLLRADGGRAFVGGHDVTTEAALVRALIGLTGQYTAVDDDLTGHQNLMLVGRLGRLPKAQARDRARELLEAFELGFAADRRLRTYSGGMRRRLDLAASLMVSPTVLFLDEPTTGLDPRSRLLLWDIIRSLKEAGTTVVLTTQYLEEADRLADRISVIDSGKVIAVGTAGELKRIVGDEILEIELQDPVQFTRAISIVTAGFQARDHEVEVDRENCRIRLMVSNGGAAGVTALRLLDHAGVDVHGVSTSRPSLDDVFLKLTERTSTVHREERPEPRVLFQGRRD